METWQWGASGMREKEVKRCYHIIEHIYNIICPSTVAKRSNLKLESQQIKTKYEHMNTFIEHC